MTLTRSASGVGDRPATAELHMGLTAAGPAVAGGPKNLGKLYRKVLTSTVRRCNVLLVRPDGPANRKEATMAANITITEAEAQVREFAAEFPGANVLRGITLCESGRITWFQLYDICKGAIVTARQAVSA